MPADLEALTALMPFGRQLGMTVDEASADRVVARLAWTPQLCTVASKRQLVHGGVLMSLADTAGALVTFLGLPDGATTATITSATQLFRPVTSGTVRAVAVPLHRGRTTVTVQTSLFDDSDSATGRPDHAGPGGPPAAPSQRRPAGPSRAPHRFHYLPTGNSSVD